MDVEHSNRVTARWIFLREIQRRHRKAAHLCDIELAKFDALVEYNSPAAEVVRAAAEKIADAYAQYSVIVQNGFDDPFFVGPMPVDTDSLVQFQNALHDGYSGLNDLEKEFAFALDKTKKSWCRNPSQGGFAIPLLDRGNTKTFYPDFLLWADSKRVVAIDTKGDHLIIEDSGRKLFHIEKIGIGLKLDIRLVTQGEWHARGGEIGKISATPGYTVWGLKNGKAHPTYCRNIAKAVEAICI